MIRTLLANSGNAETQVQFLGPKGITGLMVFANSQVIDSNLLQGNCDKRKPWGILEFKAGSTLHWSALALDTRTWRADNHLLK